MALPRSTITTLSAKPLFQDGDNVFMFSLAEVGTGDYNRLFMDLRLFRKGKPTHEGVCLTISEVVWLLHQLDSGGNAVHEFCGRTLVYVPNGGEVSLELKRATKESALILPKLAFNVLQSYMSPSVN